MCPLFRTLVLAAIIYGWGSVSVPVGAQTATVIPANEAAAHVGEYAAVEGVVAKLFTSKAGYTFLTSAPPIPTKPLPAGYRPLCSL